MTIQTIITGFLGNNTYIVENNNSVLIIDAAAPVELIKPYIGDKQVVGVLLTHGHFDHITSLDSIINEFGCKCYLHPEAYTKLTDTKLNVSSRFTPVIQQLDKDQVQFVQDDQVFELAGLNIKAVYTPGHTNCCVCFVVNNDIFSGDTIFRDGVGRTDLPTSSAEDLSNSINKLASLYKNYTIYPGHGKTGEI